MGERERSQVASGPFSAGQVAAEDKAVKKRAPGGGATYLGGGGTSNAPGSSGGGGRSSGGGASGAYKPGLGSSTVKQEAGDVDGDLGMSSMMIHTEDGGYISSDMEEEGEHGPRQNVEDLVDLTGDDELADAPVRLRRVEHQDRTLPANIDAGTNTEEDLAGDTEDDATNTAMSANRRGKQRANDVSIVREASKWKGAWAESESESEPEVKEEPSEDDGPAPVLQPREALGRDPKVRRSFYHADGPQLSSSNLVELSDRRRFRQDAADISTERSGKRSTKKAKMVRVRPAMPKFQTPQEALEWEITQRNLDTIVDELGTIVPPTAAQDEEGDTNMQDPASQDKRADRLYLFQFPPAGCLPDLYDPNDPNNDEDMDAEAEGDEADDPFTFDDMTEDIPETQMPPGRVGKMRVYKNGKVTLDWGGLSLEVKMGMEASFLQEVMMTDVFEGDAVKGKGTEEEIGGTAIGLGAVRGKFVVTPDWSKIIGASWPQ